MRDWGCAAVPSLGSLSVRPAPARRAPQPSDWYAGETRNVYDAMGYGGADLTGMIVEEGVGRTSWR